MDAKRVKTFVIAILVAVVAANAAAQSTRVDTIAAQQATKAKQLGVEGPSDGEKIVRRVLLSPLLSGGDGVYPWFGNIYGGSGISLGVGVLKRLQKAAYFNIQTGISINNSRMMRGTFAAPELWRGRLQFDTTAQWMDVKDVSFYGAGQHSAQAARQQFDYTPTELGGNLTLKPMRYVSMTGGYTMLDFDTDRSELSFSAPEAPGLGQELRYHVTRGTVLFDWRPSQAYTTRGGFYRATFEHNEEYEGRPYSFNSQEYEAVQMVPLVREQFVLAGRALMTLSDPNPGHDVPVIMMPFLGSGSTLRSFATRRFTDRNRVLVSGEYRWRPSRYIDMALFLDAGQVAQDRHQFDMNSFDVSWGLGARFHGLNFTALRLEVARGREGTRLIFSGSQPF
ncbi:MAG TPA: hypothetical protein VM096_11010 [Vicinamibacterales bacterium]|nr:hypothetical protein [Vicinamibacterales bacterium]